MKPLPRILGQMFVLLALGLSLTTCSSGGGSNNSSGGGGSDGFSFTLEPSSVEVFQDSSRLVQVNLVRQSNFTGEVTVTLSDPPEGVESDTLTLPPDDDRGLLLISVKPSVVSGSSMSLQVAGSSGGSSVSAPLTLSVKPQTPSSQALIHAALEAGRISYGTSLVYRAYALFADPRLPEEFVGSGSIEEDFGLFFEAEDPGLPADIQAQLHPFLVRPTHPDSIFNQTNQKITTFAAASSTPLCTSGPGWTSLKSDIYPIRVWAQCTGATDLDAKHAVFKALLIAESIWKPMTKLMGEPIPDEGTPDTGGDDAIDFYLLNMGTTVNRGVNLGISTGAIATTFSSPPKSGVARPDFATSGYMLLGRDRLGGSSFFSTMVHEFFHMLQFRHNQKIMFQGGNEYWFVEASAVWAESHFARETSRKQVHPRFIKEFQQSPLSLHLSVPNHPITTEVRHMYAAYIWPFFMEQERGAQTIADAWGAMETAKTFNEALEAINAQLPFDKNFHRFSVRNLNKEQLPAIDKSKRYVNLDPNFFDNFGPSDPNKSVTLEAGTVSGTPVKIAALDGDYYNYKVKDARVHKMTVSIFSLVPQDGLEVDALLNIDNKGWEERSLTGKREVIFCFDNPQDKFSEMWLVLSNHFKSGGLIENQFDNQILGLLTVDPEQAGCRGDWKGIANYTAATDVQGHAGVFKMHTSVNFALDVAGEFRPTGTVAFSIEIPDCTVTLFPDSATIAPSDGLLAFDETTDPATYSGSGITNWVATATFSCPDGTETVPNFPVGGQWLDIPFGQYKVPADGKTLTGTSTTGALTWDWNFNKQ
ncbi:MAG: hypothetical protein HY207_07190 [Nitrospirae bacterium]|nr:hypothetical protein [Nitrospirota bacterium]